MIEYRVRAGSVRVLASVERLLATESFLAAAQSQLVLRVGIRIFRNVHDLLASVAELMVRRRHRGLSTCHDVAPSRYSPVRIELTAALATAVCGQRHARTLRVWKVASQRKDLSFLKASIRDRAITYLRMREGSCRLRSVVCRGYEVHEFTTQYLDVVVGV